MLPAGGEVPGPEASPQPWRDQQVAGAGAPPHARGERVETREGRRCHAFRFPSEEEAENTAALAFCIAVSTSWWAGSRGFARLKVHRLPPVGTTGDRRPRLQVDPRASRE